MYLDEAADVAAAVPKCAECFQDSDGSSGGTLILGKKRNLRWKKSQQGKQNKIATPLAQGLDTPPQEMHLQ